MIFNIWASRISEAEVQLLEKYSERKNTLLGYEFGTLIHLSYETLKRKVPECIQQGRLDAAIRLVFKSKAPGWLSFFLVFVSFTNRLKFIFWIQDQYKSINSLEQRYLSSPPDPKLVAAGIHELNILGQVNLIDTLADGDILKWEAIEKLPYQKIFDKQLKNTIEARITKRMVPAKT